MSGHDQALGDALQRVKVVEWGSGVAAGYATRMLADLGADVTRIVAADEAEAGRDGGVEVAAFLDHGKHLLAIDLAAPSGRDQLIEHLRGADILVDDRPPSERERLALDRASLAQQHPQLLQVSVTPFGQTGPYRDFRAGDLELAYLSGLAFLTPRDIPAEDSERKPPLKMPGSLVSIYAGASAAGAAVAALYARDNGFASRAVDVSMLESLIPTLRREIALFQYEGRIASRFMRVWRLAPWGVKRCRDGYVFLQVVERHHWEGLVDMMGAPEWSRDERYLDPDFRFEHRADIESRMAPWLAQQTKAGFAWESQRRALPFAPVNDLDDVARIPQLHFRRFFHAVNASDGRPCLVPGAPYRTQSAAVAAPTNPRTGKPAHAGGRLPLSGVRVVDFGHVWAGPYCAALLADLGADVIKVESAHRLDVHRRQGPYAERRAGVNRSGVWNAQNRGKRSVTFNLSTERGRSLAKALAARADVVIENFAPGVMQRLGLDYASLAEVNPRLVMASLSAFGQQGPQRNYVGYGPSLDAWAGLDALTAYSGGEPNALGGVFPDTGSALHAAAAILAGLRRRERTGTGTYIDLSELEVSVLLVGDQVSRDLAGSRVQATGNGDGLHFPQGSYRCAGDDAWVALTVGDRASWEGLCRLLRREDWLRDAALATASGRRERIVEIDAAIAEWTRSRSPSDAMLALQRHGVPSGAAHHAQSLLSDPHLNARHFFVSLDHAEVGHHPVYGPIWLFDGTDTTLRAAPVLGADNDPVLREVLGLPAAEVESLTAERAVY
ncbi:MAG TPA: CoA transferase [Casimicrobiaceae bacterium]|nr:CoA transferase [Casimicrobiaceae bacterium]